MCVSVGLHGCSCKQSRVDVSYCILHNAMHISVLASAICSYFVGNSYVAPQKQLMLTAMRYTEDKLLEKLVEVEQWATANLDVLRLRDGDCFKAKLRQLDGDEEKRIYKFLVYHRKRLKASAALAAQLAKLDDWTSLHAAVPSAASGSRKARCVTDAGLSAQEEGRTCSSKMCENSLLEELAEVEQWATANLDVLRLRDGHCFKAKLRQLDSDEEKRIYFFLTKHKERIGASTAPAAQLAKLDCIVMAPGYGGIKKRNSEKEMLLQVQRCHFDAIKSERKRWEGRPLFERRKDGSFARWRFHHLATAGRVVKLQSGPPPNLVLRVAEVRFFCQTSVHRLHLSKLW